MFWRNGDDTPETRTENPRQGETGDEPGVIEIDRDAPRPATILKVAGVFEERGDKILELFKEVRSPLGEVVIPIHLLRDDSDCFVEVATGPWDRHSTDEALERAAVLRSSDYAGAGLEIVSAYPLPPEVEFFCGRSPAALLQLDLLRITQDRPEASANLFKEVGSKHWGVELGYEAEYLPLVEELIMAVLEVDEAEEYPPVSTGLAVGLGCFLGETIRRNARTGAAWLPPEEWGEGPVVEVDEFVLDPVGKARAFLSEGQEESLAFYADYVLEQLSGGTSVGDQESEGDRR